ncbi:hypothetical protein [uncultured Polaribacter sp.]|uniref:hypothetical protein n=1 Tax=uncultured Polaribacter sp. TaxID=174711 RepID=UPI002605631F|nr:hypothetical protein [uncultured Polaribacter sp.]
MKMFFKKTGLVFFMFSILLACDSTEQKKENFIAKEAQNNCYPNNERPKNAITYKELSAMLAQYETHQKAVLKDYVNKEFSYKEGDTESNWYSIDELKQYIAYVERLSEEKGIPLTGIKIFSAAYPDNSVGKDHKGRQTLIFAPTTTIGSDDKVAFEPLKSSNKNPVPMLKYLAEFNNKNNVNKASFLPSIYVKDENSSAANRTHIAPPY